MKRTRLVRLAAIAATLAAAWPAVAYHHFLHYRMTGGQVEVLPERFDVDSLPDATIQFYVSAEQRPRLQANDSFEGLVSQVRQALAVWDAPATSRARVAFGGVLDGPLPGRTPAAEIIFAELPPGVVGLGGPVTRGAPREGFVPILRSQVIVSDNLVEGSRPRPTFSELFFNTLVHEIGHALGLQHTLSSSAMSTDVTRSTTRAQPLAPDDIAGLSALYPAADFPRTTGSIAGTARYTTGAPVVMGSVAAVRADGSVITALTGRDGSYRIEGLPPGGYLLYIHPLPPASQSGMGPANTVLPQTEDNAEVLASGPFKATFLGGTDRPEESQRAAVEAGRQTGGLDFTVEPRRDVPLTEVTTFSFPAPGLAGVHPAFLDLTRAGNLLVAYGRGLAGQVSRLLVEPLDRDIRIARPRPHDPDPRFVRIDFQAAPFARLGPLNLLFRLAGDFYVLPGAAHLTGGPPPVIHWITPDFAQSGVYRVRGENFSPRSEVYFDGLPGLVTGFDSIQDEILVEPPAGPPGHQAVVTVYNPDGQSSAITLPDGNVMLTYPDGPAPAIRVSPARVRADSDAVIVIEGVHTNFVPGETVVGFGSSDIVARSVEVGGPGSLRVVVSVAASAEEGVYAVSVASGLNTLVLPDGLTVERRPPTSTQAPELRFGALVNSATNRPEISPGALASLFGANLVSPGFDASGVWVTFDGVRARLISVSRNQINLQVPEELGLGAAEVRVFNGIEESAPMLAPVTLVSPGIFRVLREDGAAAGPDTAIGPGETLDLLVTGVSRLRVPASLTDALDRSYRGLHVLFNGVRLAPVAFSETEMMPGLFRIRFMAPLEAAGQAPAAQIRVLANGRLSNALDVPLAEAGR